MFYQLHPDEYARARPLCAGLGYHLTARAVVDGNNPGAVYADDRAHPASVFLDTPEGRYLAGESGNAAFNAALREHLEREIFAAPSGWFSVMIDSPGWEAALPSIVPRAPLGTDARFHYTCRAVAYDWRAHVPAGHAVEPIDAALLARPGLHIPDHIHRWMRGNWGSVEVFLERGGGRCTIAGDAVVAWSLMDCVSGDACEIGIHTAPEHRRRGLATLTAAAMAEACLGRGLSAVGWHCSAENEGSWRTAEKVGFVRDGTYTEYYCQW